MPIGIGGGRELHSATLGLERHNRRSPDVGAFSVSIMKSLRLDFRLLALVSLAAGIVPDPASAGGTLAAAPAVPAGAVALANPIAGRISASGQYQWPGLYFEARFHGTSVYFTTGPGDVILHVLIDGAPLGTLVKPTPGAYLVEGLASGTHLVRVEAVTESQAAPDSFRGFALPAGSKALPLRPRKRQIEFIGDSHTVGYGDTSKSRECTQDEVWSTTDTSAAFGAKVAKHYDADYQINAISGRGIVRNYNGGAGDPLPVAYPFVLFDHAARYESATWRPEVIVIALGTNDFSTALHAGEKWATRDELHADYESTYGKFLDGLRARNPRAFIVIWATDMAEHEIEAEAGKVVAQRRSKGDARLAFVPIDGLEFTGCNWHPSIADHDAIAAKLIQLIDGQRGVWTAR